MGWWGEDGGYYDDIFERNAANTRYRQNQERNKLLKEQNELLKKSEEHWREEEFNKKLEEEIKERELQDEITRPKRVEIAIKLDDCRDKLIDVGINHNYVRKIYSYIDKEVEYSKNEKERFNNKELEVDKLEKNKILLNDRIGNAILVLCCLISGFLMLMTFCSGSEGTLTRALYILAVGFIIEAFSSFSYKRKLEFNKKIDKKINKIKADIEVEKRNIDEKFTKVKCDIIEMYKKEREKIYNSEIEVLLRNYEKNLRREVIYDYGVPRIVNHPYIFNSEPIKKNIHLGNVVDYNKMLKKIISKISGTTIITSEADETDEKINQKKSTQKPKEVLTLYHKE